ncbi:MAG: methyltransferase [Streptosporangiaceae bacterium]|jgi:SAM-dependent methyltransferase
MMVAGRGDGGSTAGRFISVDVSADSIGRARRRVANAGLANVNSYQADLFALASFDHAFVCFVLEHLAQPARALQILRTMLKPGGTITIIEGDHGSALFYPDSLAAHAAIECQMELQRRAGGDALIGRRLYPLLVDAGYSSVEVSPRMIYVDASRPEGRRCRSSSSREHAP